MLARSPALDDVDAGTMFCAASAPVRAVGLFRHRAATVMVVTTIYASSRRSLRTGPGVFADSHRTGGRPAIGGDALLLILRWRTTRFKGLAMVLRWACSSPGLPLPWFISSNWNLAFGVLY